MESLEEIGRRLDLELDRLFKVVREEVKPTTQRKAAAMLRKFSKALSDVAAQIETRLEGNRK